MKNLSNPNFTDFSSGVEQLTVVVITIVVINGSLVRFQQVGFFVSKFHIKYITIHFIIYFKIQIFYIFLISNADYTKPKKLRPILLVANIPQPEAICK